MHIPKIAKHFLIIIVLILSINSCTNKQENILGSVDQNRICIYLDGNDLKYNTDIPIAGFQFNLEPKGFIDKELACKAEFTLIIPEEIKKYNLK